MDPKIRAFQPYRAPVPFRSEGVFSLSERLQHRFQQKLEFKVNLYKIYVDPQSLPNILC